MAALHRTLALLGLGLIVLVGLISLTAWLGTGLRPGRLTQAPAALERLGSFGTVPNFSLLERSGKTIRLSELEDTFWVVNFIYTNCEDTCPLQSAAMARLQTGLSEKKNLRLVSITVDPDRDTPEVLARYADRFRADPDRWLFLTGNKEEIYRLVQEGFRLSAAPAPTATGEDRPFIHSSRFVLVDGSARIRGYYDSTDRDALRRLRDDVQSLRSAPG